MDGAFWECRWDEKCSSLLPVQPELKDGVQLEGFRSNTPAIQSDPGNTERIGDKRGMCQVTTETHRIKVHQVRRAGPQRASGHAFPVSDGDTEAQRGAASCSNSRKQIGERTRTSTWFI